MSKPSGESQRHPVTPDGRYFVVRSRLWRMADPALDPVRRSELVKQLMAARRAVGIALKFGDKGSENAARAAVDKAKHDLGERGPAWWNDGAPDYNRRIVHNTPYAVWFESIESASG